MSTANVAGVLISSVEGRFARRGYLHNLCVCVNVCVCVCACLLGTSLFVNIINAQKKKLERTNASGEIKIEQERRMNEHTRFSGAVGRTSTKTDV